MKVAPADRQTVAVGFLLCGFTGANWLMFVENSGSAGIWLASGFLAASFFFTGTRFIEQMGHLPSGSCDLTDGCMVQV